MFVRGHQYVHIKVEVPKKPLTERQIELLQEFEKIELEEKNGNDKGSVASTIDRAWDRIKKFMGTDDGEAKSKESKAESN